MSTYVPADYYICVESNSAAHKIKEQYVLRRTAEADYPKRNNVNILPEMLRQLNFPCCPTILLT